MAKKKTIDEDEYSQYRLTPRELVDIVTYSGQERAARRLLLGTGKFCPEQVAVMTSLDVAEEVSKRYLVLYAAGERIALVKPEDIQEVLGKLVFLDR